ncbi:MAG: hypothetical protein JEZ08_22440 [Clostridiales bacterium]|nr:hypothetical protein [Clostridiales bacterium]
MFNLKDEDFYISNILHNITEVKKLIEITLEQHYLRLCDKTERRNVRWDVGKKIERDCINKLVELTSFQFAYQDALNNHKEYIKENPHTKARNQKTIKTIRKRLSALKIACDTLIDIFPDDYVDTLVEDKQEPINIRKKVCELLKLIPDQDDHEFECAIDDEFVKFVFYLDENPEKANKMFDSSLIEKDNSSYYELDANGSRTGAYTFKMSDI